MAASEPAALPVPSVRRAVRRRDGRVTVGDVMSDTGLDQAASEAALRELLASCSGHLDATENGELVYSFDPRLVSRDHDPWTTKVARLVRRGLVQGFKLWIMLTLVVYFVVFVVLLVAAVVAASSRDGDSDWGGGRGRGRGGGGFHFPLWWFFWSPDFGRGRRRRIYYGEEWSRKKGLKVPFYKKVFAFVFGPDRPETGPGLPDVEAIRLIQSRKGVLTPAELVQHSALTLPEADDEMARLMASYGGDVKVSDDGTLLYVFPELLLSARGKVRSTAPDPAWRRLETPRSYTGNSAGTNALIAGINGVNLFAALSAPSVIFPQLGLGGPLAELGLVWVPATFSTVFFAVPLVRSFFVRRENRRRQERNIRRVLLGPVFDAGLRGYGLELEDAVRRVRRGLGTDVEAGRVEAALHALAAEFDADVDPAGDVLRFRFPEIKRGISAGSAARERLRLDERTLGDVVYSSADTPAEAHAREIEAFDRELRGLLASPDRVEYREGFDLDGDDPEVEAFMRELRGERGR